MRLTCLNTFLFFTFVFYCFSHSYAQTNNALNFDGADDRVNVGDSSLLNTNHLTVQVWVKIDNTFSDSYIIARAQRHNLNEFQWAIRNDYYYGSINFEVNLDKTTIKSVSDFNPESGIWVNYTATFDGSEIDLYKNGILIANDFATGNIADLNIPLYIGSSAHTDESFGCVDCFPGSIDEVRIWNRALTKQEVQSNINCELAGNESGLIAYYKFNQGAPNSNNTGDTTLIDISPNNLYGNLQNFALKGGSSNWITPSAFGANTNCSLNTSIYYLDADGDGYGNPLIDSVSASQPSGYVLDNTDCNDNDKTGHAQPLPIHIVTKPDDNVCRAVKVDLLTNQSLLFDSVGNEIATSRLDVSPSTVPITTWEAWVYPIKKSKVRQHIFSTGYSYNDREVMVEENSDSFLIHDGNYYWQPVSVSFNKWQHIAVIYTTNYIKFYKDGIEYLNKNRAGSGGISQDFLSIGNESFNRNGQFEGNIDEVRIWNIERSQAQIQNDMNADVDPYTPGLITDWKMDDITNGIIKSEVYNTYPLTFQGELNSNYPVSFNSSYNYSWSPVNGLDSPNTQNTSFISTSNISYQLTASTTYNCVTRSDIVTVKVMDCGILQITASDTTTFCNGDSVILTSSFQNNNLWNNGDTTQSITVKKSGKYYVVNDGDTSNKIKVTVNSLPAKPIITIGGSTFLCTDDTVTLSGSNAAAWKWNDGEATQSIITDTAGKFVLTVSDSLGCTSPPSDTTVITDAPKTRILGDSVVCIGTSLSLTATGGGTYKWTGPNGFAATTASIKIDNVSFADSGIYSATIKYPGCPARTISVRVYIVTPPKAAIVGLNNSYCAADTVIKLSAIPNGGIFFGNGVTGDTLKTNFIGSASVSYISPSYYGCPADTTIQTVVINDTPSVKIINSGSSFLCADDTVTLKAQTSAYKFLWSTGEDSSFIKVSAPGAYTVTVTNKKGCIATSAPVIIQNDTAIHIYTNKGNAICNNDTIQLSFNASNVLWSTGEITQIISSFPKVSTKYFASGNSINGCAYSDSILITVNPIQTPGAVTNMYPPDNSINLTYPINFSWLPGQYNTAYDFYLWDASLPRPANPYAANLYNIGITISSGLIYGTQYNWQIVSKNGNCANTAGPVQTFTLASLPDLAVQNIMANSVVVGGQPIHVEWQVTNSGSGSSGTARWVDKIYLSPLDATLQSNDILIGSHLNLSALNAGQSYLDTANINIPLNAAGKYYVIIKADDNNQVQEADESNNLSASDSVIVNIPPVPDLQVISVAAQTNVLSGTNISVVYIIKNFGTQPTPLALRTDNIYITDNGSLDIDTVGLKLAGSYVESILLKPGETKTITTTAVVPKHIYGNYFVHVYTDATGQIFEGAAEGNNSDTASFNVFLTTPPDVTPFQLNLDSNTLSPGDNYVVQYGVKNQGLGSPDSLWFDGIFLSKDTLFNLTDAIPVNWVFHTNVQYPSRQPYISDVIYLVKCPDGAHNCHYTYIIPQGEALYVVNGDQVTLDSGGNFLSGTYTLWGKLPDTLSGKYNLFAVADVFNTLFEYNKENNNIIRVGSYTVNSNGKEALKVLTPDLVVSSVAAPPTANAASNINISWSVKNNGAGKIGNTKWRDVIYLSSSPDSLKNQIFLGDVEYNVPLSPNETSPLQQKTVTLPNNISGTWYVTIVTDYTNTIFEGHIDDNNSGSSASMQINITNWADLIPVSLSVPDTIKASIDYGVQATVSNKGNLYANGSWTDGIYISKSSSFDPTATLIGSVQHTGNVPAGSAYTNNVTLNVPFTSQLSSGKDSSRYYIYYNANDNNQLFENTSVNNNILKTDSVFVYNPYVDHIVTSVTAYDTAFAGSNYNVQWSVKNIGEKAGNNYYKAWHDGLYRSADTVYDASDVLLGQTQISSTLNHNEAYNQNANYQMPDRISGDYYLIEKTNSDNAIAGEINKSNNTNLIRDANQKPKLIHFINPPASNLKATSVSAPPIAIAGQPINIIYTIKNIGPFNTNSNYWTDQLTLSTGYNPGNILLSTHNHTTGLKVDSSYTDTVQVFLPNNATGNFVVVLQTDALNRLYDTIQNNNYAYALISVSQLPPCDLTVKNITVPDSVISGGKATITWQLNNIGINPAYGYLREGVYLSRDTIPDNNDNLLGIIDADINLESNAFVTDTLTANFNSGTEGYNHVLVRTDLLNNINESDENNNVSAATDSIYISIKDLPLEDSTKDSVFNTNLLNYKINIPASLKGETIQVSVMGDTLNGSTELYVSHNKIPSVTNYDFADNNPYHKTKQIVIPSVDSGKYYLTIKGTENNAAAQQVTLFAHILPFVISSVETNHGGNTGNVTVKIEGSKFDSGMISKLTPSGGGNAIVAGKIIFESSTFIWATFNLNQQSLGVYDLSLTKTDNSKAILKNSFTIEKYNSGTFTINGTGMIGTANAPGCDPGATNGSNEGLQLTFDYPFQERTGRIIPITILFANAGNVDIPVPTYLLVSDTFPVSYQNNFPNYNQKQIPIEFKETNAPPGILRAGATGAVIFYSKVIGPVANHYWLR